MFLFPWLHYDESICNFEKATFFHGDAILDPLGTVNKAIFCINKVSIRSCKNRKSYQNSKVCQNLIKKPLISLQIVLWTRTTSWFLRNEIFRKKSSQKQRSQVLPPWLPFCVICTIAIRCRRRKKMVYCGCLIKVKTQQDFLLYLDFQSIYDVFMASMFY